MKETLKNKRGGDFPLKKNTPLPPEALVKKIGDMSRQFAMEMKNESDFPIKVLVKRNDGAEIEATIVKLYADLGSQADGTFYFSEDVRENFNPGAKNNYLFGSEIETITILE